MRQVVPYNKLSKKAKRAVDAKSRGTWNGLCPVTRKPMPSKAYNRNKVKATMWA